MKSLTEMLSKSGLIHHAYAVGGEKSKILVDIIEFLESDFSFEVKNNPDFFLLEFETFTIEDGRALQDRQNRRALSGKKIFIISTRFMTVEAQNALLKMFEEPFEGSHFFLVMPNTDILLPTLKSRLQIIDIKSESSQSDNLNLVKEFIQTNPAERLALIKIIVEEKDKGKAIDFVTALEHQLAEELKRTASSEQAQALEEVLKVKKYLHDRAPSIKLLLEHLCLFVTMSKR